MYDGASLTRRKGQRRGAIDLRVMPMKMKRIRSVKSNV